MRKLLNTLYVTNESAYLALDGENIVCKVDGKDVFRIPILNIENVVCFNYIGCSPALMGKCAQRLIPINFMSRTGKFLAKVSAPTRGNVVLRVEQIDIFRREGFTLTANNLAAKFANTIALIKRTLHDTPALREDEQIISCIEHIRCSIDKLYSARDMQELLGIEGNCAHRYYEIFGKLIKNADFTFSQRNKRPPLDAVNAVLSFVFAVYTNEISSALETVGLDSYIGFCHTLRSGRASLACDLIEEVRCVAERFVLGLINLKMLNLGDFETQLSGAVYLNDEGRKKVISQWQERKRTDMMHPYLKQKIQWGLLPYVQSNLLAKYVRGEIEEYPPFLLK